MCSAVVFILLTSSPFRIQYESLPTREACSQSGNTNGQRRVAMQNMQIAECESLPPATARKQGFRARLTSSTTPCSSQPAEMMCELIVVL